MTETDETTTGVAISRAGRDPDLPLVIIDLSGRERRDPTASDPAGDQVPEPILRRLVIGLSATTAEPIGMPPRPPAPGLDSLAPDPQVGDSHEEDPQGEDLAEATLPIPRAGDGEPPAGDEDPTELIAPLDPPTVPLISIVSTLPIPLPGAPPAAPAVGRIRARARVYPRWRRRTGTVVGHRRRLHRQSLRRWEAAVWIAALGVVAAMAGFVIRSVPTERPFVAGAEPTLPAAAIVPSGQTCVIRGCPVHYPPGPPTRVRIPAIGVDSSLESLSLDKNKVLTPPVRYDEAGWYAQGVVPGDTGPAVIAGHVDSIAGPGVFFNLRTLVPGAAVSVERGGVWVTFRVTDVKEYPKDEFPTDLVYRATPDPELRLITCGGDFDRVHGRYYDNVVVFARLAT